MSELAWLNQVQIYFSILQRKAMNPNDFADRDQLSERIIDFQDRYNTTAKPFDWTYTRDDLNAFLHRLARHSLWAVIVAEVILTGVFLLVILGSPMTARRKVSPACRSG